YVDGEWQLEDATQLEAEGATAFYVPIITMKNEGPGYTMGLVGGFRTMPRQIAVRAVEKP
ncbi:MAG: hypothetical protein AAFN78_04330, partial [Pseudomonadota bacterium]